MTNTQTPAPVKITSLTPMNVDALRMTLPEDAPVVVTNSTATFTGTSPRFYLEKIIQDAARTYGRRGHPVQSLQAVKRKLGAALDAIEDAAARAPKAPAATPPGQQTISVQIAVVLIRRILNMETGHPLTCYGRIEDDVIVVAARSRDTASRLALDAAQTKLENLALDVDRINSHSFAVVGVR